MGMQVGDRSGGPMADINVTPLVDVVLVLLIIFMVVTPMLVSGVDVRLPMAVESEKVPDDGTHIIVSIDENQTVYLDKTPYELDKLPDALLAEVDARSREDQKKTVDAGLADPGTELQLPNVLVKGDRELVWSDVHPVLTTLKDALQSRDGKRQELLLATDLPESE